MAPSTRNTRYFELSRCTPTVHRFHVRVVIVIIIAKTPEQSTPVHARRRRRIITCIRDELKQTPTPECAVTESTPSRSLGKEHSTCKQDPTNPRALFSCLPSRVLRVIYKAFHWRSMMTAAVSHFLLDMYLTPSRMTYRKRVPKSRTASAGRRKRRCPCRAMLPVPFEASGSYEAGGRLLHHRFRNTDH